jgi:hypothetical protein
MNRSGLSSPERAVAVRLLDGLTYHESAENLDITDRRLLEVLGRMLERYGDAGGPTGVREPRNPYPPEGSLGAEVDLP